VRKRKYPQPTPEQLALREGDQVTLEHHGEPITVNLRHDPYQIPEGDSNPGMWVTFVQGLPGYWELAKLTPMKANT
jgi:hypothetical protein